MVRQTVMALMVGLALVGAGCGLQSGKTMQTYTRGQAIPPMVGAADTGMYSVYAGDSMNAITTVHLDKGDMYGFKMSGDKTVAVANDKEIPLDKALATSYYWKYEPSK